MKSHQSSGCIFFISPWSVSDPLSEATSHPHLALLAKALVPNEIAYFSVESGDSTSSLLSTPFRSSFLNNFANIQHCPLLRFNNFPALSRISTFRIQCRALLQACANLTPIFVICRGTMGIYGDLLYRRFGIPYAVESFEPHAHYMLQTRTWRRWDPKFLVQRRWEERVKRTANTLITVSKGYARHLEVHEGISPDRLDTVPCWVDGDRFRIDSEARISLRQQLGIGDRLAVVYVGKFGGIYSSLLDLEMLRHLQDSLGQPLFVMVLTSSDAVALRQQLLQAGFTRDQLFVDCVPHDHVNAYLNAADLALSFINSGPWSFACSAIKHGEYWASGLPLLMPPGVGDEASWLETERAGAIAQFNDHQAVRAAAKRLLPILSETGHRQRIRKIGLRERGVESLHRVYQHLLDKIFSTVPAKS